MLRFRPQKRLPKCAKASYLRMIIKIKTNLVLFKTNNGVAATIQVSMIIFYMFIEGIFVAERACQPFVWPQRDKRV